MTRHPDRLVLDTDVASGLFKQHRASGRPGRASPDPRWCITFVTLGELWRWAADGLPLITGNLKDHVDFAEHEGLQLVHR